MLTWASEEEQSFTRLMEVGRLTAQSRFGFTGNAETTSVAQWQSPPRKRRVPRKSPVGSRLENLPVRAPHGSAKPSHPRPAFQIAGRAVLDERNRSRYMITWRLFKPRNPNVGAHSGRGPVSFISGKRWTNFRMAI
jgi:hypothetical protein